VSGQPRLTFGLTDLSGGLGLIPVMIGLFAVSRVLAHALDPKTDERAPPRIGPVFAGLGQALGRRRRAIALGGGVGVVIGAIPGAGADIAAYVAQAVARRLTPGRTKGEDDHDLDAIAPAGAANNAAIGGALVPATVLGIPGDSLTAIVIGVLMLNGITPGPAAFLLHGDTMAAVLLAFLLANLLLVPAGLLALALARPLLAAPPVVLMPLILGVCLVGSYAVERTTTALVVTMAAGVLGLLMERGRVPLAPVVLGLVLGPLIEEMALTSLMKAGGDPAVLVERPGALGLALVTAAVWGVPAVRAGIAHVRHPRDSD